MFYNLMNLAQATIPAVMKSEEGQDLAEYALVLVFIAVIAVAGITALGGTISGIFDTITGELGGGA